jgi:hypothetical protein
MSEFEWDNTKEQAAQLFADGELTDCEIAEKLSISRMTLYRWRQVKEFADRVEEHLETFRQEVRRLGLASRERRVRAVNTRWNKVSKIVEAQGDGPDPALLKELRELEKQAAQELGQWSEKHEIEQVTKAYVAVSPEDL